VLWYAPFSSKNSTFFSKKKINNKTILNYVIPNTWNLIIVSNTQKQRYHIKTYSSIYFFVIPIITKLNNIKFDKNTNQILITVGYTNSFTRTYFNTLSLFNETFLKPNFLKLKFKGKGYYIYKNHRNTVTPQFGYSHRLYLYSYYNNITFLSKSSLIIFGLNKVTVRLSASKIKNWRTINIFTGRGVRFSKQILYKKSGKVSTYR
jgi:hypothetical protein